MLALRKSRTFGERMRKRGKERKKRNKKNKKKWKEEKRGFAWAHHGDLTKPNQLHIMTTNKFPKKGRKNK